jgi:hypothetical protein
MRPGNSYINYYNKNVLGKSPTFKTDSTSDRPEPVTAPAVESNNSCGKPVSLLQIKVIYPDSSLGFYCLANRLVHGPALTEH